MNISTPQDWTDSLFGQADLGDPRGFVATGLM